MLGAGGGSAILKPWEVGRSSEVGEKPGEDGAWKPGGGSGSRRGDQMGQRLDVIK